jgi:hypothetical protein
MKEPTQEEIDQFFEKLTQISEDDLKPKILSSAFVLMLFLPDDQGDIHFALQLGLCMLLEKPLIVLALKDAYVPPRILKFADVVVRAATVEEAKAALRVGIQQICPGARQVQ